jgi:hypothetical protein
MHYNGLLNVSEGKNKNIIAFVMRKYLMTFDSVC